MKTLSLSKLYTYILHHHLNSAENYPEMIESGNLVESLRVFEKLREKLSENLEEEDMWREMIIEYPAEWLIDELDQFVANDAGCIDCIIERGREDLF